MSRALNVIAFHTIKAVFDSKRAGSPTVRVSRAQQVQQASYIFETALHYKNLESAVWLLKLSADPELQESGWAASTALAKDLVYRTVEADPRGCTWQALSVYMEEASSLVELRRQTPQQRALAIQDLQHAGNQILPGNAKDDLHAWQIFANPWTLLLRLVENCQTWSLPVHDCTAEDLRELRLTCLRELTDYNDPAACFEIATREKEFGSEDWVKLMECAAGDAQPDACWLLAIHYWREDGLLAIGDRPTKEADENEKLQSAIKEKQLKASKNLGFAWANNALLQQKGRQIVLARRAEATAALSRTFISLEAGGSMLRELLDHTHASGWVTPQSRKFLALMLQDYNAEDDPNGIWTLEKCLSRVKRITDRSPGTTKEMGVTAAHLPASCRPPGTMKRASRSFRKFLSFLKWCFLP